ncbi:MAG: metalloregulator ArsR/SmtB family transcription factor [Deltaproteobacteria bacterium]|nr:metalloregulator ArsR/SmtB family transcription factor [Deltaproteobacteria bacterium]
MSEALDVYKALADESRLRLLHVLSKGSFNVQELTTVLKVSQSTISHHLKVLQAVNLASAQKEGTWVYYTLPQNDPNSFVHQTAQLFLANTKQSAADIQLAGDIVNRRRDQTRHFFDSVAKNWKELRETQGTESFFDIVKERIPSNAAFLELGCGSGPFLDKIVPRSGMTVGVDYSQGMLDEARRTLGSRASQVDLRLGYLEHLPIGDDSIDVALVYMVLHHLPTPVDALKDACRVLKPGGQLLIVDLVRHDNEYMRERYADLWLGFDPEEMKRWASSSGFADAKVEILGHKKEVFLLTTRKKEEA